MKWLTYNNIVEGSFRILNIRLSLLKSNKKMRVNKIYIIYTSKDRSTWDMISISILLHQRQLLIPIEQAIKLSTKNLNALWKIIS